MTSVNKIHTELVASDNNFKLLKGSNAVIFGGARFTEEDTYYNLTRDIAYMLSREFKYNVITGGGPGIMEAGNRGCKEGNQSVSVGLNIYLDFEQERNKYQGMTLHYDSFLSRKYAFFKDTSLYIIMPGGFGTLDELFETLTLMQCGKIKRVPIVLVDRYYYEPLVVFIKEMLLKQGCITEDDLNLITLADNVEEIRELLL
jgi:uncharacterized protein (TIGR00730 family)